MPDMTIGLVVDIGLPYSAIVRFGTDGLQAAAQHTSLVLARFGNRRYQLSQRLVCNDPPESKPDTEVLTTQV
jgi:hypothetical protein